MREGRKDSEYSLGEKGKEHRVRRQRLYLGFHHDPQPPFLPSQQLAQAARGFQGHPGPLLDLEDKEEQRQQLVKQQWMIIHSPSLQGQANP